MPTGREHDDQALQRAIDRRPWNDPADDAARLLVDALRSTLTDEAPTPSPALRSVLEHGLDDHERPGTHRPVDAGESVETANSSPAAKHGHRSAALR